jgi:hypothetical protein
VVVVVVRLPMPTDRQVLQALVSVVVVVVVVRAALRPVVRELKAATVTAILFGGTHDED